MPSRFAAVTNNEISRIIKQAVPEIHASEKVTKFGLQILTGKALSFRLEFIDETSEKVFCFCFVFWYILKQLFISVSVAS